MLEFGCPLQLRGRQIDYRRSRFRRECLLFADLTALHSALVAKEPTDFVSHFIFEPVPYAFEGNLTTWIEWKTTLANAIEVDPRDIVLTGSAAIGFSLNPRKDFKAYDEKSDIDCGVVSQYHFELAWRYLRQLRPSWLSLPNVSKRAIETHRKNYVFSGTIATDSILAILPFGDVWQSALETMSTLPPTVGRDVKLRIYKDYDALRHYQANNIANLRGNILSEFPDESIIQETSEIGIPTENASEDDTIER